MVVFLRLHLAFLLYHIPVSHYFPAFYGHLKESVDGQILPPEAGEDEPKQVHPILKVVPFEAAVPRHELLQEAVNLVDG